MAISERVRRWLVPPIMVPVFLVLLLMAVMVSRW
jgi:hypothetical protein